MKKSAFILILILTLLSGRIAAQCDGSMTANITGGSSLICINTSPGTFTAVGGGETGSYTYLWYKNSISTGITTQTYSPGVLTSTTTVYCAITSGTCTTNTPTVTIVVVAYPTAPVIGTITQPTCTVSTGSVPLSGLPAAGDWQITITPGGTLVNGSGSTTTLTLSQGTYTFTVRNYAGCVSPSSGNAVIQAQPSTPTAPLVGTITAPTCLVPTGSVVLNGLPTSGTWTLTRLPDITTTGSGSSYTASGLAQGIYFYTVTNAAGCTSPPSGPVTIPAPPPPPSAPVVGLITQPTCAVATGSVALSGLPLGTWTVTVSPGGRTVAGSGSTITIADLAPGSYTFTVTNSVNCTSPASASAVINPQTVTPSAPQVGSIIQPTCALATGSVTLNSLPSGSWVLTRNPGGVTTAGNTTSITIPALAPGTYTYTVTNSALCTSVPSSPVGISAPPASPSAPLYVIDCTLGFNHAVINVTSPVGSEYQYSLNGGPFQVSPSFPEIPNGSYYIAVRNSAGCTTNGSIFEVSCGCIGGPSLVLSASTGATCGITPVTVADNTFANATVVTITENGAGSVDQTISSTSPFSFTYTPAPADRGRTVVITVTTDNPLGAPCSAAVATYTLTVNGNPSAPLVGTTTNISCTVLTGSVVLYGLPSSGTWTLTRLPDNVSTSGTSASTTVADLPAGTYTFTVASEEGCLSPASAPVVINPPPAPPSAPVIGTITHPTCTVSVGSVALSGLPSGSWVLTRNPGGVTTNGSGSTFTVSNVPPGTYTFTVTNPVSECVSLPSAGFTVNAQPPTPSAPIVGKITGPTCTISTGNVILLGLPAGPWKVRRIPGGVTTIGSGITDTITGLPSGTYNFTVSNSDSCTSSPSINVIIPVQPVTPPPPVVGTITQPTLAVPSGSVVLSGLPSPTWILTRLPSGVTTPGSTRNWTVSGLAGGLYFFTVTNSVGCVSDSTVEVRIASPGPPDLIITDPPSACYPGTVDLTAPAVTKGSTDGLFYTYWMDEDTTMKYNTPAAATEGTYYIKGTTVTGFYNIQPVNVTIDHMPVANPGSDQVLSLQYSTTMEAVLGENESGYWQVVSGTGILADTTDPSSVVDNLSPGDNIMLWIVSKGACFADTAQVTIKVGDIIIPTLITPNGDTKNEYFVILGLSSLGRSELIIFDRRGAEVFRNDNYDNKWNGVDYNENPLPNDTYFFVLSSAKGRMVKGYIVIRR